MSRVILLVEDDRSDVLLTQRAIHKGGILNEVRVVGDGVDALDYLRHRGAAVDAAESPRPELILLDLKMPRMGGLELLSVLQLDPELRDIPVVVLTGSNDPTDRDTALARGAGAYLVKPLAAEQIVKAASTAGAELVVDAAAGSR